MTCETSRVEEDELQLIDFSEEDDYLIAFPFRNSLEDLRLSVTFDNLNECDRIKLFESMNSQVVERIDQARSETTEPRRPSFLRKSLAWDSAFFTGPGVLNLEELFMINKGFKIGESNQQSLKTQKHIPPRRINAQNQTSPGIINQTSVSASKKANICPQNKVKPVQAPKSHGSSWPKLVSSKQMNSEGSVSGSGSGSDSGKMKNKTTKAGAGGTDLSVSKRSRSGLPKSKTCFTSPINQKDLKVDCSYESSSSASSSSKAIRRKTNPRNTKPTASMCSSSTSPCSSIEGWFSESLSLSSENKTHHNTPEYATRASMESLLLSGGPKRKIKSSCLRMPSPKIGFFDEVSFGKPSPLTDRNMLNKNKPHLSNLSPSATPENCSKVRKTLNGEHDGRKVSASFSKLKPDGQIHKEISKRNMERKRHKNDTSLRGEVEIEMKHKQDENDQKENVCNFEDQVNGLSRCFEVIDLDSRDVGPEVKGQLSVHCARTPFAEKTSGTE